MSTQPTAEALRAATAIARTYFVADAPDSPHEARPVDVARMIDSATGLPALLEERDALREALAKIITASDATFDGDVTQAAFTDLVDAIDNARAALAPGGKEGA